MDLSRLLHPRTIAVVGATDRRRLVRRARRCSTSSGWATPARSGGSTRGARGARRAVLPLAGRPARAARRGGGGHPGRGRARRGGARPARSAAAGAVVYGAGFGEIADGARAGAASSPRRRAALHGLPVCGPNGNGIVALHDRAALWGDALRPLEPGARGARLAERQRRGQRARHAARPAAAHGRLVRQRRRARPGRLGRRAGARRTRSGRSPSTSRPTATASCSARRSRAAPSAAWGSRCSRWAPPPPAPCAAAAHTGAVAGDQRVFRALVEEAGAAWAEDVHELLELAKALAVPGRAPGRRRRPRRCSPARAATRRSPPTSASGSGCALPALDARHRRAAARAAADAATVGNPLDYTALIWGEVETLRDIIATTGADPGDRPAARPLRPAGRDRRRRPTRAGARCARASSPARPRSPVPVRVASTLPELLDDEAAARFAAAGVPAVVGSAHRAGLRAALRRPPGDPARLREIGAAAGRVAGRPSADGWLAEHEAKQLLRAARLPVVEGPARGRRGRRRRRAGGARRAGRAQAVGAGAAAQERAGRRSRSTCARRTTCARPTAASPGCPSTGRRCWPSGWPAGRRAAREPPAATGSCPRSWSAWAGSGPRPTTTRRSCPCRPSPDRVEAALRRLRGAARCSPAAADGRRLDLSAVARAGRGGRRAGAGRRACALIELNPVLVHERGGPVVVDAVAQRAAP